MALSSNEGGELNFFKFHSANIVHIRQLYEYV